MGDVVKISKKQDGAMRLMRPLSAWDIGKGLKGKRVGTRENYWPVAGLSARRVGVALQVPAVRRGADGRGRDREGDQVRLLWRL